MWQARALERNVIVLPGLPADVIEQAAVRIERLVDRGDPEQAAVLHSLAVARLRQGRFAEVEPLCAEALESDLTPEERATVLATVALARRALGHSYAEPLAQAVALAPDADLVAEAAAIAAR
jgi:hypothetical protein